MFFPFSEIILRMSHQYTMAKRSTHNQTLNTLLAETTNEIMKYSSYRKCFCNQILICDYVL